MAELGITQEDLDKKVAAAVEKATGKLTDKNETLMGELKNARKRVEAFKDFDPEDVRKALEKAKEEGKKAATALADRGEYEKALDTAKVQHKQEIAGITQERDDLVNENKNMRVTTAMDAAMSDVHVPDHFRPAVSAMHASAISVIEKDGKKVAVVGEKSVSEFLTEWAGTDQGKHFVGDGGAGGGGAGGGKGNGTGGVINPWHKDTRNLTQQGQIERDQPAVATQMKREAGA